MTDSTPFGYVYVLSSPAMPDLVKVGHTTRRPEVRAAELSSASGVPLPFEVKFSMAFEHSAIAEGLVHKILEEQGLRPAHNREFFECSVEQAANAISQVAEQLHANDRAQELIEQLTERGLFYLEAGSLANMEKAISNFEFAWQLGGLEQGFLAGTLALDVSTKRNTSYLRDKAWTLFEETAAGGVARSYAYLARMALQDGTYTAATRYLGQYVQNLPTSRIPEEELEFLVAELNMVWHPAGMGMEQLYPLRRELLKYIRKHKVPGMDWASDALLSPSGQVWEKYKFFVVGLILLLIVYQSNPALAWLLGAIAAFIGWKRRAKVKAQPDTVRRARKRK